MRVFRYIVDIPGQTCHIGHAQQKRAKRMNIIKWVGREHTGIYYRFRVSAVKFTKWGKMYYSNKTGNGYDHGDESPYLTVYVSDAEALYEGDLDDSDYWFETHDPTIADMLDNSYDPDADGPWWEESDNECEGHESLRGDMMGESDYCDGSCKKYSTV